jgi:two-component system, NtrC family, response regulator HydG
MARIFVIDDNDTMREGMTITLKKAGHDVLAFKNGTDAVAAQKVRSAQLVVTDLKMDVMDGIEVTRQMKAADANTSVLLVTAFATIETAVEAMRLGAWDFIPKPFSPEVLRHKVEAALQMNQLGVALDKAHAFTEVLVSNQAAKTGRAIIGESEIIQKLTTHIKRAAATDATVLIQGESGTGKELVAHMLHQESSRKNGPFISTHCAALAETLLESELFGHERGAFTGAVKKKLGRFELADGGTIFLDEIGEISASVQTKLLRVLQEREVQRVGGEDTVKVDVRVVCATNRDLKKEVTAGRFREDLYYRLHVVPLVVPPLRERPEDLGILARHFIAKHAPKVNPKVKGITPEALSALHRYAWPGNVRELENAIEQSLVFGESEQLTEKELPLFLSAARSSSDSSAVLPVPSGDRPLPDILDDLERQLIERAYAKAGQVKTETARLLGIKTSALYYKLEKYGLIAKGENPTS